ncbi:MAG: hypothetical protein ACRD96_17490 [Bryobacteraceae bacterium]
METEVADSLSALEERIVLTVDLVARLRRENAELRAEREKVRARIEKLLGQIEHLGGD